MVKQHKRFVQNQVQTHFSQKEKKKYPFLKTRTVMYFFQEDMGLDAARLQGSGWKKLLLLPVIHLELTLFTMDLCGPCSAVRWRII